MTNTDLMADVFLPEPRATDDSEWGIVRAVNDDGSYMVQLRGSSALTRCGNYCTAVVGDRVHVVIKKNGLCEVIGRRGGTIGGGGEVVMTVNDASNYVAGKVFAHAGTNDPVGALLCDGRAVSRTEYWELFDAIGTTYGAGDGSSTFNLPNIESRTIIGESDSYALGSTGGEESHKLTVAEIPAHSHTGNNGTNWGVEVSAGFNSGSYNMDTGSNASFTTNSNPVAGGSGAHNNMQPYIVMRYFITTGKGDPVSGINPADYVVEWGNTGIWSWRKYASGLAECWGTITSTLSSSGSQLGYPYWSTGWYNLPFAFANVPTVTASANVGDQATMISYVNVNNSSLVVEASANASGSKTCEFHMMVKGKWKDSPASGGTETIAPTIAERFEGIESEIDLLKTNKVLWTGGMYMQASQTATLSEAVSEQPNGIWLVFSWYDTSVWTPYDGGWNCHFVPKWLVQNYEGKNVNVDLIDTGSNHMAKTLYVHDTKIVGSDENIGTYDRAGITTDRSEWVLRAVIGV